MPVWGWVLIGVAAAIVVAVVAGAAARRRRTTRLRGRFGPEYERTVDRSSSRREAEAELSDRERRRSRLQIRPLDPAARELYAQRWQRVQADFVDAPATAVNEADTLVTEVMRDRGYPMDDFDQRAADVSVDHPDVVECYRKAHRISESSARGEASTEDLRHAMQDYRRLFDDLLEPAADEPTGRERDVVQEQDVDRERMRR